MFRHNDGMPLLCWNSTSVLIDGLINLPLSLLGNVWIAMSLDGTVY